MADTVEVSAPLTKAEPVPVRHSALVRVTHWITAIAFLALAVTGVELVISHPRFYWGDTGNVETPSLFELPIPASRASVKTGYSFVLPDQNGWSRSLHFQAAWALVFAGAFYVAGGMMRRHFRRNLVPDAASLRNGLGQALTAAGDNGESYNAVQRLTYLGVVFGLVPLMIWTGLAMSPAVTAVFPRAMSVFGGHQSARTIHFVGFGLLLVFVLGHVAMVYRAGFRSRTMAMITGRSPARKEEA